MSEIVARIGIADCHGIELYHPEPKEPVSEEEKRNFYIMNLRATSNRQRHAVVFRAELTTELDERIKEYLKQGMWESALALLKEEALKVSFPECSKRSYQKSWNMIPNPDLDPWS